MGIYDEVVKVLKQFHDFHGSGTPAQAPAHTQAPGTVAATFARTSPRSVDPSVTAYLARLTGVTNTANALATVDPSLPPVVGRSAGETTAARTALDTIQANYASRRTTLQPVSGTVAGQAAILGTKIQAVQDGATQTRGTTANDQLRKVIVELLARKYAAEATAASGQNGAGTGQGGGVGQGTGSGGGGGSPSIPSQATLPTQQYSQQQIAAIAAILAAASKKKGGGGKGQDTTGSSTLPAGITVPGGTSDAARRAIASALGKRGLPYGWGANGPNAYDCSSLMVAAVKDATGATIPRTTYDQIRLGQAVSPSAVKPGDLVFNNFSAPGRPEHVQMYIGGGKVIHAPQPGDVVKVSNYVPAGSQIRRIFQ